MTIDQIRQPVRHEFDLFVEDYRQRTQSNVELLVQVVDHLNRFPGKQLRPLLVLLAAQACRHLSPQHVKLASAVELLHNATLMHDDVVDESDSRRSHDSVRHRWGNQVAVLCGDFFLAQTMAILQEVSCREASQTLCRTVSTMCQGELMQLASLNKSVSTHSYIDIIGSKTASLMASCCQFGAIAPDNSTHPEFADALHRFGYHYGIVFQIRDDMNDFDKDHDVAIPLSASPAQLIEEHSQHARQALLTLPESPARQTLLDLLLPDAPQPVR